MSRILKLLRERQRLLIIIAVTFLILLVFINVARDIVNNDDIVLLDTSVANAFYGDYSARAGWVFQTTSLLGKEVVWILTVALLLFWLLRRQYRFMGMWLIAIGGGPIINNALKSVFVRPRPVFPTPNIIEHGFSFPSGHSMDSMIVYGMLIFIICRYLKRPIQRVAVGAFLGSIIALVGFSRIYLGVHYLSDVIGGYAAGLLWLIILIEGFRLFRLLDPSLVDQVARGNTTIDATVTDKKGMDMRPGVTQ